MLRARPVDCDDTSEAASGLQNRVRKLESCAKAGAQRRVVEPVVKVQPKHQKPRRCRRATSSGPAPTSRRAGAISASTPRLRSRKACRVLSPGTGNITAYEPVAHSSPSVRGRPVTIFEVDRRGRWRGAAAVKWTSTTRSRLTHRSERRSSDPYDHGSARPQ
jgi:hypothetical protein